MNIDFEELKILIKEQQKCIDDLNNIKIEIFKLENSLLRSLK